MENIILYFSLKYNGDFLKIYNALVEKEPIDESLKKELFSNVKSKYTTIFSNDYPQALKEINCPPFVLYYYGDISLINNKTIVVVGTKSPSDFGKKVTKDLIKDLVENDYTIISGMDLGVNSLVHRTAIENHGKTVAVLSCGIEKCCQKRNDNLYKKLKDEHLIISEFPFDVEPSKDKRTFRYRIIACLSDSVLVTECTDICESMLAVNYGLEQNKYIYAVPSYTYEGIGSNRLLREGAYAVLSANDIINKGK